MFRTGTWNVRSIKNKENKVIQEMEWYNIDVLDYDKGEGNGLKV